MEEELPFAPEIARISTSELKAYRQCPRKWQLNSRDGFNIKNYTEPQNNLDFGTIFHEALAEMYLQRWPVEEIIPRAAALAPDGMEKTMEKMLIGYKEIVVKDLQEYTVLGVEFRFEERLLHDYFFTGVVDLLLLHEETNTVYAMEHKTAKSYREGGFKHLDEQVHVYNAVLNHICRYGSTRDNDIDIFAPVNDKSTRKYGGIILNEVRKLSTKFEHERTLVTPMTDEEIDNFKDGLRMSLTALTYLRETKGIFTPIPGYFSCKMCEYEDICMKYGYKNFGVGDILKDLGGTYCYKTTYYQEEKTKLFEEYEVNHATIPNSYT